MTSVNGNTAEQKFPGGDEDEDDERSNFLESVSVSHSSTTGMAGKESKEKDRQKKEKVYETGRKQELFQHLTTAAQACILLYVVLIIYYCFSGEFLFFTWHPLLLSIGWMFLMAEAILVMSKDNLFTGTLSKKMRVRLHWIFHVGALTCILIGFAVVYINKNSLNKTHFKSWHGLFGLIGVIGAIWTNFNGIAALYHGDLRNYIKPKINKFVHIASGVITFVFGGLALILSVYTKWFARNSNENSFIFLIGLILVLVPVIWTIARPAIGCFNRLKDLVKEKRDS